MCESGESNKTMQKWKSISVRRSHTHTQWITHWMDRSQACCTCTRVCTLGTETSRPIQAREISYFFHFSSSKNAHFATPTTLMYKHLPTLFHSSIPGDEQISFFSFPHREVEFSSIWVYHDCRYYHRHTNTKKRKTRAWWKREKHMQQSGSKKENTWT